MRTKRETKRIERNIFLAIVFFFQAIADAVDRGDAASAVTQLVS
jgi:hypothetical protein